MTCSRDRVQLPPLIRAVNGNSSAVQYWGVSAFRSFSLSQGMPTLNLMDLTTMAAGSGVFATCLRQAASRQAPIGRQLTDLRHVSLRRCRRYRAARPSREAGSGAGHIAC